MGRGVARRGVATRSSSALVPRFLIVQYHRGLGCPAGHALGARGESCLVLAGPVAGTGGGGGGGVKQQQAREYRAYIKGADKTDS